MDKADNSSSFVRHGYKTRWGRYNARVTGASRTEQAGRFAAWLDGMLREAGLSPAEFSRRIGFSRTAVSTWLNGGAAPHRTGCYAIADALANLGLPVTRGDVLVAAGYRDISYNRASMDEASDTESHGAGIVKGVAIDVTQAKRGMVRGETETKRLSLTLNIERYLDMRPELRDRVEQAAIEAAILAAAEAIKAGDG